LGKSAAPDFDLKRIFAAHAKRLQITFCSSDSSKVGGMIRRLGMLQDRELGRMMFQDHDQSYFRRPIKGQNPNINARPKNDDDDSPVLHSWADSAILPDSLSAIVV
jgi:hypothetical protein